VDQLAGEGSSLTLELTMGGALIAAIVAAVVWVIMHGRAKNVTPAKRDPRDDQVD
jgi:hypothetical protein